MEPRHTALLVVDPQHDFCSPVGAVAQHFGFDMSAIQQAIPRLNRLIDVCRRLGVLVVWIRGEASETRILPNHKIRRRSGDGIWLVKEGGPGAAWAEGMVLPLADEPVVTKDTYDAFEGTNLHIILRANGILTTVMTGFTTNVCVETSARRAYVSGYYVVAVSDCTGATTANEYEGALFNIRTHFGDVLDSDELLALWGVPCV